MSSKDLTLSLSAHAATLSQKKWAGFFSLSLREIERFLTMKSMTVFPPLISTALYIIVFGFFMGRQIVDIHGFSYIMFILPGLLLMSVTMNAFMNASSILYMARYDQTIQDVLLSPLSYFQIVSAYTVSSIVRGVLVGVLVCVAGVLLVRMPIHSPAILLLFLMISAQVFGSFGIMIGLRAEHWEHIAIYINFVVTPLTFLGGVFYSVSLLPPWLKTLNLLNPMFYMVNGLRYGILGISEVSILGSFLITLLLGSTLLGITVYLFKIGYKLKT
ncbi:MAG: ABC transporter permease [Deltaproteobacteria bacterium]|nr:ABC transporter permease [Deltaproteobacteria bacterium]